MRCVIPQITWNSCQQILSLDFDPSCKGEHGFYRLVTVGADTNLLVWHVSQPDTIKPVIQCVSELNRHQKAVNVVRFSPDGNWIASGDDDAYVIIWRNDRKEPTEENWSVEKSLRKHLGDVTDLSWSADGNFLLSASIDSTAVLWDVKKGSSKFIWTEHSGYVQGVAFDPAKQLAATISIDRTLRVYDAGTGKLKSKVNKYVGWVEKSEETEDAVPKSSQDHGCESKVGDGPQNANGEEIKKSGPPQGNHIFQGDDLATFCRRLCFSPGGEFLIVPAGAVPAEKTIAPLNDYGGDDDSTSSDPAKKKMKLKPTEKPLASNNAVILFCRNDLSVPCAVIPTDTSYSVACRFNPVYFKRSGGSFQYGNDLTNPVKKDERRIYCTGKLDFTANEEQDLLLDSPHRLIYAIATNNSVIIGSTDKVEPLAVVKNIHFARLTDLSWTPDGKVLVTSSTDGYVSLITFDHGELGEAITESVGPPDPIAFPIPVKEVKVKVLKPKEASAKKEKTPAAKKKRDVDGEGKTPSRKNKTKTPKSGVQVASKTHDTPGGPKRRTKVKPIKFMLEAQAAAGLEKMHSATEPQSPVTVENVERKFSMPYVCIEPLNVNALPEKAPEEEHQSEEDVDTTATPVKLLPQKNTLDKWIVRKKSDPGLTSSIKAIESASIASSAATDRVANELKPAKKVSDECVPTENTKTGNMNQGITLDTFASGRIKSIDTRTPGISESATAKFLPFRDPDDQDKETTVLPSSSVVATESVTSSKPTKQPRRVQLITLSTNSSKRPAND